MCIVIRESISKTRRNPWLNFDELCSDISLIWLKEWVETNLHGYMIRCLWSLSDTKCSTGCMEVQCNSFRVLFNWVQKCLQFIVFWHAGKLSLCVVLHYRVYGKWYPLLRGCRLRRLLCCLWVREGLLPSDEQHSRSGHVRITCLFISSLVYLVQ